MDVNVKYKKGRAGLLLSTVFGYIEVAKLLIEAGADVNLRGNSALKIALNERHTEIVLLFKEAGAKE